MSYLSEIEHATQNLIQLITSDNKRMNDLSEKLEHLKAKQKIHQWDFQTSDLQEDFLHGHALNAFYQAEKAGADARTVSVEVDKLKGLLEVREFSIQLLSGALLHIVKQGLSTVHGGLGSCPKGRVISDEPEISLKDVVWQGRNQSQHFEENSYSPRVVELFELLEEKFGEHFSLSINEGKSMAKEIVYLLGWNEYRKFIKDCHLLCID